MFSTLLDGINSLVIKAFNCIISFFDAFLTSLITPVISYFPSLDFDVSFLSNFLYLVDCFFDLRFLVILVTAYFVITLALIIINWILGLIPTIN